MVSVLAVSAASYFCFTSAHALVSFDARSCTPLAAGDPGKCVSNPQALLDDNRPYPGITVDGYFGAQTQQAVIDLQSVHNLARDGIVAARTAHAINEFSPRSEYFQPCGRVRGFEAGPADEAVCRAFLIASNRR
jgi:peptidoglycan hydrolase-like protein with peptidoglycan-binding domain